MKTFSFERARTAQAFRISPQDTNYFAILSDASKDGNDNIAVIEIFNVGGATPPNSHVRAHEFFYVLHGSGVAVSDGEEQPIRQGDALLLKPGSVHVIRNTGAGKPYTLTVMTPNEGFSELIRSGEPVRLDAQDLAILEGA